MSFGNIINTTYFNKAITSAIANTYTGVINTGTEGIQIEASGGQTIPTSGVSAGLGIYWDEDDDGTGETLFVNKAHGGLIINCVGILQLEEYACVIKNTQNIFS